MARTRTTKTLAQRIDLNYFKRPTRFKRAKFWLSVLLPALAVGWIAWHGLAKDSRVYSSGRMSAVHAVLEKECAACHVLQAGQFSAKTSDSACLACHDGPIHHANAARQIPCADCHTEHRGRIHIAATSDRSCAQCHSDLIANGGSSRTFSHISSFPKDHPEFRAIRETSPTAITLAFDHAAHLKPIRRSPTGPMVQLECGDCHRGTAVHLEWRYADANYSGAGFDHAAMDPSSMAKASADTGILAPKQASDGRELMAPIQFSTACSGCHSLAFDKRSERGVPHDKPEVVHAFLVKQFSEYIAAHPSETRVARDPSRDLSGKSLPPEVRILSPAQWVAERTAEAETLLWRKTCKQCHLLRSVEGSSLPQVAPPQIPARWFPHTKFDHDAHRGFSCVSCHENALTSTASSDVLVPGIATCQRCHAPGPGYAESGCFECHTYHDWSRRKEVTSTFRLP